MPIDIFISYSSKDKAIADAVCHFLEKNEIICCIAPRNIVAGISYARLIVSSIENSKLIVLVFSNNANFSTHVKREIELAASSGKIIIPFRIEEVEPIPEIGFFIREIHWLDAINPPLEAHLVELVEVVKLNLQFLEGKIKEVDLINIFSRYKQPSLADKPTELENYGDIMRVDIVKAEYFRMLAPTATRGSVFDVDIKQETVVRIPRLLNALKDILFKKNRWVVLSGDSGLSKTTSSKILAHDVKTSNECKSEIHVRFANELNNLQDFANKIEKTKNKWLLIIDDLHRTEYGAISEKLASLVPLLQQKKRIFILATSRLSLVRIKESCNENKAREREVAEEFKEVKLIDYEKDLNDAKVELIDKIFDKSEIDSNNRTKLKKKIIDIHGANFVSLGFALLPIYQKKAKDVDETSIIGGIQEFLINEFKEILNFTKIKPITLLRAFVCACYESVVDEPISVEDFDLTLVSKSDYWITLNSLARQGLFYKHEKWTQPKKGGIKRRILNFGIPHARVAGMYLEAIKAGFWLRSEPFEIEDLCVLSNFRACISRGLDFGEIVKNFKNLKILNIQNIELRELPESFYDLKSLKTVYLKRTRLEKISEKIGELELLQTLDLRSNALLTLPESIGNLKSLQTLDLEGNQLTTLPESITKLESLETLNLRWNKLSTLPELIGNLKSLIYLSLNNNQLTTLPESIGNLSSLKKLELWDNQFTTLLESIGNLSSLKELWLNVNKLTALPESISDLKSLQTFWLGTNKLTALPESIGNLSSLQTLNLWSNQLLTLPESIGNLKSLETLYLGNNYLATLPESIGNLKSLKELLLYNNQLTTLPESITNLNLLKNLYISNNPLDSRAKSVLKQLKKKGVKVFT